ncbi:hypothetical protein [Halarsenatibacter silvermanii]|uniref:Uncharacterized protein n=1 Tax=Halarsenatibacter silvermanii TaxID=321763 RepID=A0A1G9MXR5_9FIRM|nr:hypothetical protein [Halarsenatibacter silvermanii]SDL79028.1 hypothetical protein SAMN04488692_10943 [Halarsenatibacter silvermanii]
MSDKGGSMSSDSEKLFQNIGERLKKQRVREEDEKKSDKDDKEKKKDGTEADKETDDKEDKKSDNTEIEKPEKTDRETKKEKPTRSWKQREVYQTSFKVKPEMEENFEDTKRRFRRELNLLLSKQDAIEIGWLLLKNLDDSFFEELRVSYSPEDDLIEALKELIEEYY